MSDTTTTMTASAPESSDLVDAILDRQLEGFRAIIETGVADDGEAALPGLADATRAAIIRDLVEPNGEAGVAAFEEASRCVRAAIAQVERRPGAEAVS